MKILVADSGGTRTDWCLAGNAGDFHFFETVSYHPHAWSEDFFEEQALFWEAFPDKEQIHLLFYGAGCLAEERQDRLTAFFCRFGFASISVGSDIHAAGLAALGSANGAVAILGTGSVLAIFKNEVLQEVRGGFGYLLGDEGSGYYFGKLLLNRLLNGQLPKTEGALFSLLGEREVILASCYGPNGKSYISHIAEKVKTIQTEELELLHLYNIRLFFENYCAQLPFKSISFCGSYAYHRQKDVHQIATEYSKNVQILAERPIRLITEYLLKPTV
jgi:glucosamine kinase